MAGVFQKNETPRDEQFNQTRIHVAESFGIQIDNIIPVRSNEIPKTSSGKIQRHILKERFENGDFKDTLDSLPVHTVPTPSEPETAPEPSGMDLSKLHALIRQTWIDVLQVAPEKVTLSQSFSGLGGTSLQAAEIHATLEDRLGDYISHEFLQEANSVQAMADYIRGHYPELVEKLNKAD